MNDGRNFFDQPVEKDLRTYDSIKKIVIGQCHNYINCCFLDYHYFKKYFELIEIDFCKQETRCSSKSNTKTYFYYKSRARW